MFEKRRKLGEIHRVETDWGAILGVIIFIVIGIALFS
jgi:hypothetical protein